MRCFRVPISPDLSLFLSNSFTATSTHQPPPTAHHTHCPKYHKAHKIIINIFIWKENGWSYGAEESNSGCSNAFLSGKLLNSGIYVQKNMERCTRCCLHNSIKAVNLVVTICGAGMIVYSLWLLKMWQDGVSELPTISSLPRPWFIYTCLGVGIAVCLSTLAGHMVANCINNYSLCIYIVTICSLVFLEVAVLVAILFNLDWERKLMEYIDEHHQKFESFVIFHLTMCRMVLITILVAQINVLVLAIILWAIGTEPRIQVSRSDTHYDFNHSFLLRTSTPILHDLRQICRQCQALSRGNPRQSLLSYIKDFLTVRVLGIISNT
ncbi:hypothetical protein I3843_07G202300 [Carya illinoinensis]|nr:hypothetical protein I3843_07G202300 [Carya illinoinensis]